MGCDILVDGYNVIKNSVMFQMLEQKSLAAARDVLVQQLKNRYRLSDCRVTVIFDGDRPQEQESHDDHIRVIFSRYGETADSVILRLAAQSRLALRSVHVYSDDVEVQEGGVMQGGSAHSTKQLTGQLNEAPRDVAHRALHRQKARRIYGIDPAHKPDDEPSLPRHKGKKKKKSSRRHN
jgi:uncharacterized protein